MSLFTSYEEQPQPVTQGGSPPPRPISDEAAAIPITTIPAGPQAPSPAALPPAPSPAKGQTAGNAATPRGGAAPAAAKRVRFPRFSLRTVFMVMAALCGLLALATAVDAAWVVLFLWVSLMVTAHITGNLSGSSSLRGDSSMDEGPPYISPTVVAAPSTRLREKAQFGRNMVVFTATSAAGGCILGLAYLIFGLKQRPPVLGLLIGGLSAAVIAGLLGFLAGSFVNVFRHAFRQASGAAPPVNDNMKCSPHRAEV